eukprot:TRINITY_DN87699_c0_g1_i1.p1 TRINITY_DN87699_c0_g1~~TRINITY_DN87699_c0_g1_i1.p1  ORF type:complete len:422 (-),score=72.08 TRINITY_DN87699_c0_g1_i1:51-1316(-)
MAEFSADSAGQLQLVPAEKKAAKAHLWPELMPDGVAGGVAPVDPAQQILDAAAREYLENIVGADEFGGFLDDPSASETQLALAPAPGMPYPELKVAGPLGNTEPKSLLNTYCQKVTKRPVTKGDVAYSVQHTGGGYYQGTVTLHCLGGIQFAGDISPSRKDAEKKAAEQALQHYSIPSPGSGQDPLGGVESSMTISITPASVQAPPPPLPQELAEMSSKAALNTVLGRAVKVGLSSGSVHYDCSIVPGGFQAIIRVPCLPGLWSQKAWSGEVCTKKKDAENSAAHYAVSDILTDPTFYSAYSAPRPNAAIRMGGYKGIQAQREKLTSSAIAQSLDIVFEGRTRGQAPISHATTLASVRALINQKRIRGLPDDFMFEVNGASLPRDQEILCLARELIPQVNVVSADLKGSRVRLRPAPSAPY